MVKALTQWPEVFAISADRVDFTVDTNDIDERSVVLDDKLTAAHHHIATRAHTPGNDRSPIWPST